MKKQKLSQRPERPFKIDPETNSPCMVSFKVVHVDQREAKLRRGAFFSVEAKRVNDDGRDYFSVEISLKKKPANKDSVEWTSFSVTTDRLIDAWKELGRPAVEVSFSDCHDSEWCRCGEGTVEDFVVSQLINLRCTIKPEPEAKRILLIFPNRRRYAAELPEEFKELLDFDPVEQVV